LTDAWDRHEPAASVRSSRHAPHVGVDRGDRRHNRGARRYQSSHGGGETGHPLAGLESLIARDKARAIAKTEAYAVSRRERKRVEMLFAHLKRILKLDRLRPRGPNGVKDEFLLATTAQNLRKLAKLVPLPPPMLAA
jgi:hypothetical protein